MYNGSSQGGEGGTKLVLKRGHDQKDIKVSLFI